MAERSIMQLPLDRDEAAMHATLAAVGAAFVSAVQLDRKGDELNAARNRDAGRQALDTAVQAFELGVYDWSKWAELNRKFARLAIVAFPDTPIIWHGATNPNKAQPGETPR